ncbi:hypothetical protein AKJ64_02100 [candidate division MSBL1 archaeon SCGC-AAA259E17]|uniref:TIR domain-containing protein n=1 Tax=candidate division MSBL1 archaeon SCGC-AAA259E17 TaxID=1698263 RepID=A0A133UFE8_9EURY|nr:hypothetical protein AKJ64_02100 [candidate division MSBL1 archaeon SCGC-AAA259E17]
MKNKDWQIFTSCSTWKQDEDFIDPVRREVRTLGANPYTYGIDEELENPSDEEILQLIMKRVKESEGMIVVHSPRYEVNGYISSSWLEREGVLALMEGKPVFEFYEPGIKLESLHGDFSINQIELSRSELSTEEGIAKLRDWIEDFFWHIEQHLRSWTNLTTPLGAFGGLLLGGLMTGRILGAVGGGVVGGGIGEGLGRSLDSFKPRCPNCPVCV